MKTPALAPAIAVAGALTLAGTLSPAAAQQSGTFVLTQAGNEIATEQFTRSGDHLETRLEVTGQAILATDATLGAEGVVSRVEVRVLPPGDPDADPMQSFAAEFAQDSVSVEQPIGTAAGGQAAAAGTVPYVDPSPSYMEQILRRARALGGTAVTVQIWVPGQGNGQVVPAQVTFGENGSAAISLGATVIELQTDDEGRVLGGEVPSQGVTIERR